MFNAASASIAQNDDWGSGNPADLAATFSSVGAFALPAGSADAALVLTLAPGSYSAILSGKNGAQGIGLVQAYDLEASATAHRLVNMSTRAQVGTGAKILIPGLVIDGSTPKRLLIRAVGPSLAALGLPAASLLADLRLEIVDREARVVATNDDWEAGNPATVTTAATTTSAFALSAGSRDAALVVTLVPGIYTVLVLGADETSGVALVEAYEIP